MLPLTTVDGTFFGVFIIRGFRVLLKARAFLEADSSFVFPFNFAGVMAFLGEEFEALKKWR